MAAPPALLSEKCQADPKAVITFGPRLVGVWEENYLGQATTVTSTGTGLTGFLYYNVNTGRADYLGIPHASYSGPFNA